MTGLSIEEELCIENIKTPFHALAHALCHSENAVTVTVVVVWFKDAYALVTVRITARRVVRISRSLHGLRRATSTFVLGTCIVLKVGENGSGM